jgi:DNA-binding GntR family transcriptional regulator
MDPAFLEKVCADHWAMIDACEQCDRSRLVALVQEHLPLAKDRYLKTYNESLGQGVVFAARG